MKTFIALPLIAIAALSLSACTKHSETENVTINDTSTTLDSNATDDAANATLENGTNTADALTNG